MILLPIKGDRAGKAQAPAAAKRRRTSLSKASFAGLALCRRSQNLLRICHSKVHLSITGVRRFACVPPKSGSTLPMVLRLCNITAPHSVLDCFHDFLPTRGCFLHSCNRPRSPESVVMQGGARSPRLLLVSQAASRCLSEIMGTSGYRRPDLATPIILFR